MAMSGDELTRELDVARRRGEIPYSLLDRLLERPRALDRGLARLLGACGDLPLRDDRLPTRILGELEADLGATAGSPLKRYLARTRVLSQIEESRLARRIEFARRRLERAATLSREPEAVRTAYFDRIETPEGDRRNAAAAAAQVAPDQALLETRWREYLALRNDLVESNLPLVDRIAGRYRTYGIPHADLVQHGCVGLIRAATKFDWRKGVRFRTYAEWWIRQAIERATDTDRDVIHVPRPMRQKISKANRLHRAAGAERPLDSRSFARLMHVDAGAAARVFSIKSGIASLEQSGNEESHSLKNELLGPDLARRAEREEHDHLRHRLDGLIDVLPEREQKVINLRYGLAGESPHTLEEVGQILRISRERVRQLQLRAIDHLRLAGADPRLATA